MSEPQYQIPLDRTANMPVTEGIHPFKVISFEEGEGDKGPYWLFHCQCLTPGEETKNTVRLFCSLTPQSRWRLELFLDAVGAPKTGSATADKFVGRMFRGKVSHGEYQGRPQANIDEMWPVNAPKAPAAPAAQPVAAAQPKAAVKARTAKPAPTPAPSLPDDVTGGAAESETSGF